MKKGFLIVTAFVGALFFSSCAPKIPQDPPKASHVMYEWHDDGGPGEISVKINLSSQKAVVKRGGRLIGWCFVATGKEGKGTPAGTYHVMEKIVDKHSNKYGWVQDATGNVTNGDAHPGVKVNPGETYYPAPMPYWQRLTSYGIGMHVGVIPEPGRPASHGCIRMPKDFAPILFSVTKVGTPVQIVYGPQQDIIAWNTNPPAENVAPSVNN